MALLLNTERGDAHSADQAPLPTQHDPHAVPFTEMEPLGGLVCGRYRIERLLGRGGMGEVYLAHDSRLKRPVALKRVRLGRGAQGVARARLQREAEVSAAVSHPSLAAIHDVIMLEDDVLLVLEYVEGRPLDHLIREQALDLLAVLRLLRTLVSGLAYAHRAGVVHCDIKPANVMVVPDGGAKVLDFGIAIMPLAQRRTQTSGVTCAVLCTPAYAAPEVLRGMSPTPASDVYAVGLLLDECLDAIPAEQQRAREARLLRRVASAARETDPRRRPGDAAVLEAYLEGLLRPGWTRTSWRAAVPFSLVGFGCLAGAVFVLEHPQGASAKGTAPVIAVVTRAEDRANPPLSAAAAGLLRGHLMGVAGVRVVTEEVPAFGGRGETVLPALAARGITHVLLPTVVPSESGLRLTVLILRAADGRVEGTLTRYGTEAEFAGLTTVVGNDLRRWAGATQVGPPLAAGYQSSSLSLAQYSQAVQYASRPDIPGNLQQARQLLEAVTAREPDFAHAHAELGRVLWLQFAETRDEADLNAARLALLDAISKEPELSLSRLLLAQTLRVSGRLDEAEREVERVLGASANDDHALRILGSIHAQRGDIEAAIASLEGAVVSNPGNVQNYQALGSIQFGAGRYDAAAHTFDVLAQMQPDNAGGWQMLGAARQMLEDREGAVEAYERSLAIRPTAAAISNLATLAVDAGDYGRAARLYRDAITLQANNPSFHRNLGDALRKQGRADEAAAAYRAALALVAQQLSLTAGSHRLVATRGYLQARLENCRDLLQAPASVSSLSDPVAIGMLLTAHALCSSKRHAAEAAARLRALERDPTSFVEVDVLPILRSMDVLH